MRRMYTINRILTSLLLLVVLMPPVTLALVSLEEKNQAQEQLQDAIGNAAHRYQQRSGLQSMQSKGTKMRVEEQSKLAVLEARKLQLRRDIIKQKRIVHSVERKYTLMLGGKEQLHALITAEKARLTEQLRTRYLLTSRSTSDETRDAVLSVAFHGAADRRQEEAIIETQMEFIRDLVAAEKAFWKLENFTKQREEVLNEYHASENRFEAAVELVERSEAQLQEIKDIMADVHTQVLRMQGELARIDARLKAKAERALIEKGLLDPKAAGMDDGIKVRPAFSWPVYGRVSAGFHNESYKKHFGVPHHGADIVVGQDTPVGAAADGVVFLVRDGGKTGYSYILIGHRGGYATLYGHVSQALVSAGQEVTAGQAIALSGGTPGTHGAGPMTTGAHVHFEVIQAGINIDPLSILP